MPYDPNHPLNKDAGEFTVKRDPAKKNVCYEASVIPHRIDTELERMLHERAARIEDELLNGFHAMKHFPKSVTFFGSARFKRDHPDYQRAMRLSSAICSEGYAVVTGGGPGIMEAGNAGSKKACGAAVGFNIELPSEQVINDFVTHGVNFHYFFARKVSLFFSAEAYVFFPGGFGTLDEFFELVTLIQTHKLPAVPIILVGTDFWGPVNDMIEQLLLEQFETISPEDVCLYTITDDEDEVLRIVKEAPLRSEYSLTPEPMSEAPEQH